MRMKWVFGGLLLLALLVTGYAMGDSETERMDRDAAKALALAQVEGAAPEDMREFEAIYRDGQMEYAGTIVYGGMEYDFEIDAESGTIQSWEEEPEEETLR